MHPFFQRRGFQRFRRIFRWCRISLWFALFVALAAIAYLHLVGLPDFVKQPMLRRLLAGGISAQFSNIQLGWERGPSIIIENADFSEFKQPLSPRLTAGRGELAVDWDALRHAQIALRSVQVAGAQLQIPVSKNQRDTLLLTNVSLDLVFRSNDVVRLNFCRGNFQGIQTDLIGEVTHASAIRNWKFPGGGLPSATNAPGPSRLQEVARVLKKIHFTGTPTLRIEAGADGRDQNSFHAELNLDAPSARTPWGNVTNLSVDAACARLIESGHESFLQVGVTAAGLTTPWAKSHKMFFLTTVSRAANSNLVAEVELDATDLHSDREQKFSAAQFSWSGSATLAASNFSPQVITGKLHATGAKTTLGSAREFSLEGTVTHISDPIPPDNTLGAWAQFVPWTFDGQTEMRGVDNPKLRVDHAAISGSWKNGRIGIEKLDADLYGGHVNAGVTLDVASRELRAGGVANIDPHAVSQLLGESVSNWLTQLDWTASPKVNAQVRVVLPPWTNRPPGWSDDVDDSLQLAGDFTVGESSFHPVPVLSASGHVTYTNRVWHVSRLHTVRADGDVDLDYMSGPRDFHYLIDSRMNPAPTMPLVSPNQPDLLDEFVFKQPPAIHAEIWGNWEMDGVTGIVASAQATNFTARGESVQAFGANVEYTNQILTVHNFVLRSEECQANAPWLQANLDTGIYAVSNAAGFINPPLLKRVLRGDSPDFLDDIHFDSLPSVAVSGTFSLTNMDAVNLRFLIAGVGLHFTNLVSDRIAGEVDWIGRSIALTNITASLYKNGSLMGWVTFLTKTNDKAEFHANLTVKDIDLPSLASSLSGTTNRLEGRLDGDLDVLGPNSADHSHLQGRGRIHVHNALLWDIKIFGILSPVLNLFSPGWGYSRAREASADFAVAEGAVSSENLVVRCTGFVLKMHGSVNKSKQINARLEAVLSKEVPVLGPLLSMAFTPFSKLFEYHLSGPLSDPVLQPVYVPKFISFLLHPFKGTKTTPSPAPEPPPAETK